MSEPKTISLSAVRRNCLDCSGGSPRYVMWCSCDGLHSTRCEFWRFRFGVGPDTFKTRWGDRLVTPAKMPPADIDLDDLPGLTREAAMGAIDLPGYQMEAVEPPRCDEAEMARRRARMAKAMAARNALQANGAR